MALQFLNSHYDKWIEENTGITFTDYLIELDIFDKFEYLIEDLNTCNCCIRHNRYKPSKLMPIYELPVTPKSQKTDKKDKPSCNDNVCKCYCRSFCRQLCVAYDIKYKLT